MGGAMTCAEQKNEDLRWNTCRKCQVESGCAKMPRTGRRRREQVPRRARLSEMKWKWKQNCQDQQRHSRMKGGFAKGRDGVEWNRCQDGPGETSWNEMNSRQSIFISFHSIFIPFARFPTTKKRRFGSKSEIAPRSGTDLPRPGAPALSPDKPRLCYSMTSLCHFLP